MSKKESTVNKRFRGAMPELQGVQALMLAITLLEILLITHTKTGKLHVPSRNVSPTFGASSVSETEKD